MISDRNSVFIAGVIAVVLCAVFTAHAAAADTMIELGCTNYPDHDYSNFAVSTKQECSDACLNDARCKAATFVHALNQNPSCWLKDYVEAPEAAQCDFQLTVTSFRKDSSSSAPTCRAAFSCNIYNGPATLAVQCYDQSDSCTGWLWELPDGGEPDRYNDQTPPVFQFDTPGTYRIQLSAWNSAGTDTDEKTVTVTAPSNGYLAVSSSPSGADVYVNGGWVGTTGSVSSIGLAPGVWTVTLKLTGYNDFIQTVTITSGQTTTLNPVLTPSASNTGSLYVVTDPKGAAIYLDTTYKGTSPLTIESIAPGSHTLKITKSGYAEFQQTVAVSAGKETSLTLALTKEGATTVTTTTTTTTTSGTTGEVSIASSPSGAGVTFDGQAKGTTPVQIKDVKPGSYTLVLSLDGFRDYTVTVPVQAGKATSVKATLTSDNSSPEGSGTLSVTSTPTGANVYLDGEKVGTTPLIIPGVGAGTHNLLLTMQGYDDIAKSIEIADGSSKDVDVSFGGGRAPGFESILALVGLGLFLIVRRNTR